MSGEQSEEERIPEDTEANDEAISDLVMQMINVQSPSNPEGDPHVPDEPVCVQTDAFVQSQQMLTGATGAGELTQGEILERNQIRNDFNFVKEKAKMLLNHAASFYKEPCEPYAVLDTVESLESELLEVKQKWKDVEEEMGTNAHRLNISVPYDVFLRISLEISNTSIYFKRLKKYVLDGLADTTETTFRSAAPPPDENNQVPQINNPVPLVSPTNNQVPVASQPNNQAPFAPQPNIQVPFTVQPSNQQDWNSSTQISVAATYAESIPRVLGEQNESLIISKTSLRTPTAQPQFTERVPTPLNLAKMERAHVDSQASAIPQSLPENWRIPMAIPNNSTPNNYHDEFMPKLSKHFTLPKFRGDVRQYRKFIDTFNTFVDKRPIPVLQKLILLHDSLEGRAYHSVKHLTFRPENYEIMKNLLDRLFGSEDLANDQLQKDLDQFLSSGPEITYDKLPKFVNSVTQYILALISTGQTYNTLNMGYTNRISSRLSWAIHKKFTDNLMAGKYDGAYTCKLEALLAFLELESRAVERIRSRKEPTPRDSKDGRSGATWDKGSSRKMDSKPDNPDESLSQTSYKNMTNNFHVASSSSLAPSHPVQKDQPKKPKQACIFCTENHFSYKCNKPLTPQERKDRVISAKGCLKCLKRNHEIQDCKGGPKYPCRFCDQKHYSIICAKAPVNMNESKPKVSVVNLKTEIGDFPVFLWTAHVWAEVDGRRLMCRVLLDPGSQSSHVTHSMAKKLRSKPADHIDLSLATAGGHVTSIYHCGVHNITLRSRYDESKSICLQAIELECLSRAKFPILRQDFGLSPVADHTPVDESEWVDVLIGVEKMPHIEFTDPRSFGEVFGFHTMFGWIFGGSQGAVRAQGSLSKFCGFEIVQPATRLPKTDTEEPSVNTVAKRLKSKTNSELRKNTDNDIQRLWEFEDIGLENNDNKDDEVNEVNRAVVQFMRETTRRDPTGRYVIRLPFNENIRSLGLNDDLSRSRLNSFLKKLRKEPSRLEAVDKEIKEYIDLGYAEPATPRGSDQLAHWLPIQAVFKPNPQSPINLKTRVVKDASARKNNELGLNDVIHAGPNLLPNIIKVLMKFRQYRYAMTADIERAFHMYEIAREDRSFLRFFWPLGISTDPAAKTREFWANRLDFGLKSSPFIHCMGIQLHLERAKSLHPDQESFIQEISEHFYIDDFPFGADTLTEAQSRIKLLFDIFEDCKMPLKKWSVNSSSLGDYISTISPVADPIVSAAQVDGKFLGVLWNQKHDTLSIQTRKALYTLETAAPPSKRILLKGLAQLYDPLGINQPTVINAKILLQDLWKAKYNWDTPLDGIFLERFHKFKKQLRDTRNIAIPRHMFAADESIVAREIHVFSDATLNAFGCVAFIREVFNEAESKVHFCMAKAKVAPIKPMSIHRLELMGALLAARLLRNLKENIDCKFDSVHLHSDNSSVLGWLRSPPERWSSFVANRTRRILSLAGDATFHYVKSSLNSADLASRGSDISLPGNRELWTLGPNFLRSSSKFSTQQQNLEQIDSRMHSAEFDAERKATVSSSFSTNTKAVSEPKIFFENTFSSWLKAVRFWALIRRLKEKAKEAKARVAGRSKAVAIPSSKKSLILDPEEMIEARFDLIRLIQRTYFEEEVKSQCRKIKQASPLYEYAPFLDSENIIRCKTRLQRSSELTENQKFPIIMPATSNFSKLLIKDVHERECFHSGGIANTLHNLRRNFFVLHARKLTRQIIKQCATCRIFHNESASLPVAQLPSFRLETSKPFEHCGCDFAGPFRYKKDSGEIGKSYILLFTCATSRAVHLELTTDLSTVEVLCALQKFINRFPTVRTITSDNGLSFQRAAKELALIYEQIKDGSIKKWLADSFLKWSFIPPTACWFGGWWERQVQTIKRPLRKILGSAIPHFRDLEVIVSSIEAMTNRRPITTVATDAGERDALSPADLIFGYSGNTILPQYDTNPATKSDSDKTIFSKRKKYQERLLNAYWKQYQGEYLQYLGTAHKRRVQKNNPLQVGDICLMEDTSKNRALWPLCRVLAFPENTTPQTARSCTIKTARGQILNRPIMKLYPIERAE